jgi:hypothetical protein
VQTIDFLVPLLKYDGFCDPFLRGYMRGPRSKLAADHISSSIGEMIPQAECSKLDRYTPAKKAMSHVPDGDLA